MRMSGAFALFFGLASVATAGTLRWRGRSPLGFQWNGSPLSQAAYAALAERSGWKTVSVPSSSSDGPLLRGLVRPSRAPGAPFVVFFNGNSSRLLVEGQTFLEALARGEDFGLAVVSGRGFDGSPGRPGRELALADAAAALRWLRAHDAGDSPLHIVGFSLGTMPAVHAALEAQAGPAALRPRSVSLLAPFTELRMFWPGRVSRYLGEQWDALPPLRRLEGPALVIHGDADGTLPVSMGRHIGALLGAKARYLELPGVGHLELMTDARSLQAIREMIRSQ
jgi:uncharacterized protein